MTMRFMGQCVTLGFNENDRKLLATPLYFGGGRYFTLCTLYFGGTTVFYPPPYQPKDLIETVNRESATILFLVPTLLRRLLTLSEPGKVLMPKLRILISSGSILHAEERERIKAQLSPYFVNPYSSTEGGAVSVLQSSAGPEKAGSVGRAAYRTEFEIVDEEDRVVPAGEVGRIRHRSPWLPDGFYNDPEESRIYFKHGCYYTGDLGKVDEDGFLYVVGRTKDMIIRGGINIYPAEIEQTLLSHAAVHDAAVVGWESTEFGEDVAAFVQREGDVEEAELIEHCRASLASYKVPKAVLFVEELPKNALGKVLKNELQKKIAAGRRGSDMAADPHRDPGSLIPLFEPKAVALVGASPEFSRYGGRVFHFLNTFGFKTSSQNGSTRWSPPLILALIERNHETPPLAEDDFYGMVVNVHITFLSIQRREGRTAHHCQDRIPRTQPLAVLGGILCADNRTQGFHQWKL